MYIEHNSRELFFRSPFGAVKCSSMITLRVAVSSFSIPEKVSLFVNGKELQMYYIYELTKNNIRIYEHNIVAPETGGLIWYSFYAKADGMELYYGNNDAFLGGLGREYSSFPPKQFQITVYDKDYSTPDWFKNSVVYQIFPDRFYRSGDTPFHGIERRWGEEPYYLAEQFGGTYLSNDFFGGTLKGIEEKLPYLSDLGVTAIYMNPIFKAFSNHRYDAGDYERVDETLGTNEDFVSLAKAAKERGIRLILDGVFSHTGADSKYFNKYGNYDSVGAYQSKDSPYYNWYSFSEYPEKYESWWGFKTLPNTRELEADYVNFILESPDSVIKQWLERGASGWRLDVADELPDEFIMRLRKAAKSKNPDSVVIGEVWEDASNKVSYGEKRRFLLGQSLDGVMNYVFRDAVLAYLTGCDARLFTGRISSMQENYPPDALYSSMSLISTHDVPRALTVLSDAPDSHSLDRTAQRAVYISPEKHRLGVARLKLAVAIQMTMPGAPTVYYGDEIGMSGYADPFNRSCFEWDNVNEEIRGEYKKYIALRNAHPALRTGSLKFVYSDASVVCYFRAIDNGADIFGKKSENEAFLICVNASPTAKVSLSLGLGRFKVDNAADAFTGEDVMKDTKHLSIVLEPLSVRVFSLERSVRICNEIEYLKD